MRNILNAKEFLLAHGAPEPLVKLVGDRDLRTCVSLMSMSDVQWMIRFFFEGKLGLQDIALLQGLRHQWELDRYDATKELQREKAQLMKDSPHMEEAAVRDKMIELDAEYRKQIDTADGHHLMAIQALIVSHLLDPAEEWHA